MTFDIANLPGVRAQFELEATAAQTHQVEGTANLVGGVFQAPGSPAAPNLPPDLKRMTLSGGRYYVVTECNVSVVSSTQISSK